MAGQDACWRARRRGGNHGWAATKYAVLHTQEILKQFFFTAIQQLFGRLTSPTHPSFRHPITGSARYPDPGVGLMPRYQRGMMNLNLGANLRRRTLRVSRRCRLPITPLFFRTARR
jgi:hypothetical protein